jgi:hypothetical protein
VFVPKKPNELATVPLHTPLAGVTVTVGTIRICTGNWQDAFVPALQTSGLSLPVDM